MSVERAIICDMCAFLIAAGKTAAKARADVKEMGGKVSLPGGRDLCPKCLEKVQGGRRER
jgi:hypothetical protein